MTDLNKRWRDALSDASLYIKQKHVAAGLEILLEEEAAFAQAPDAAGLALHLINAAYLYFAKDDINDEAAAEKAIEQFFRMAEFAEPDLKTLNESMVRRYKRALLVTRSSALPLRRVFRQTSLIALLETTHGLVGAVGECGCGRGMSSIQILSSIAASTPKWTGERFHVFDSFEGLSAPSAEDMDTAAMEKDEAERVMSMTRAGNMAFPLEEFSKLMHRSGFPDVTLHKGWIPAVFEGLAEDRFRFVHVDVDLYQPTLASFEYFYPRLVSGGVIVTDDYNWPGGREAVDQFCAETRLTLRFTPSRLAYLIAP